MTKVSFHNRAGMEGRVDVTDERSQVGWGSRYLHSHEVSLQKRKREKMEAVVFLS